MPLPPDRFDYVPLTDRPVLKWPGGARVAFWIAPNVEHYEYLPPPSDIRNPWPRVPHPDRHVLRPARLRQPGRNLGA